jgi:hypothetical protein
MGDPFIRIVSLGRDGLIVLDIAGINSILVFQAFFCVTSHHCFGRLGLKGRQAALPAARRGTACSEDPRCRFWLLDTAFWTNCRYPQ